MKRPREKAIASSKGSLVFNAVTTCPLGLSSGLLSNGRVPDVVVIEMATLAAEIPARARWTSPRTRSQVKLNSGALTAGPNRATDLPLAIDQDQSPGVIGASRQSPAGRGGSGTGVGRTVGDGTGVGVGAGVDAELHAASTTNSGKVHKSFGG